MDAPPLPTAEQWRTWRAMVSAINDLCAGRYDPNGSLTSDVAERLGIAELEGAARVASVIELMQLWDQVYGCHWW